MRPADERQLLSLIAEARRDASAHSGVRMDAALTQFVAQVKSLRASRRLGVATATSLERQALATEGQAGRHLRKPVAETDVALARGRGATRHHSGKPARTVTAVRRLSTTTTSAPTTPTSAARTRAPAPTRLCPHHTGWGYGRGFGYWRNGDECGGYDYGDYYGRWWSAGGRYGGGSWPGAGNYNRWTGGQGGNDE